MAIATSDPTIIMAEMAMMEYPTNEKIEKSSITTLL